MKRNLTVLLLSFLPLMTATAAFAQKTGRRAAAPKPAAARTKVDLGKLDQNTYTNDFFALKFEFPDGWLVGDHTLEAQLTEIQKGAVKMANPKNQQAMNAAMSRVTPLLGGYKALPGTPENSSLRVAVEDLKTLPQIVTEKDYLNAMLASLKAAQLPTGFEVSEIKDEMIGEIRLNYLETSFGASKKRTYATVRKGYAVLMSIESYDEADFDALHKVLSGANLNYKK